MASYNVYIEEQCDLKKWGIVIIVWDEILLSIPWILPKVFNLINLVKFRFVIRRVAKMSKLLSSAIPSH